MFNYYEIITAELMLNWSETKNAVCIYWFIQLLQAFTELSATDVPPIYKSRCHGYHHSLSHMGRHMTTGHARRMFLAICTSYINIRQCDSPKHISGRKYRNCISKHMYYSGRTKYINIYIYIYTYACIRLIFCSIYNNFCTGCTNVNH